MLSCFFPTTRKREKMWGAVQRTPLLGKNEKFWGAWNPREKVLHVCEALNGTRGITKDVMKKFFALTFFGGLAEMGGAGTQGVAGIELIGTV